MWDSYYRCWTLCFLSTPLCCSIWGIKRLPNSVWSPFFLHLKIAAECQSICTWLVWAFPFILHQKAKNLIAEWSNGEQTARLRAPFAWGSVCWEHKDVAPLDGCCLFASRSRSNTHSVFTSADVDTLAALSVVLCALGNNKTMMLPISSGQQSHLATYPEIKL